MSSTQNLFESLPEKPDRRAHPRSHAHKLAYVQMGEENGGVALNFSEGGLAIAAAEVLTSDYFPSIRFQLPSSDALIESSGQVSWMSASKKEAGIRFIDLADGERDKIREWIATKDLALGRIQGTRETIRERDMEFLGIRIASKPPIKDRKLEVLSEADEAKFASMFPSEKSLASAREGHAPSTDTGLPIAQRNSRNESRFSRGSIALVGSAGVSENIECAAVPVTQTETNSARSDDIYSVEDEAPRLSDFANKNPVQVPCVEESWEGQQQCEGEDQLAQPETAKSELTHDNSAESESPQPADFPEESSPLTAAGNKSEIGAADAGRQEQKSTTAHVFTRETDLVQQLELHRKNQAARLLSEQGADTSIRRRSGWPLAALAVLIGTTCFAVGVGVGDGYFDKLLGRDQELEQRSGATPANLPAATAGENEFAGASAVAGSAQKSVEASSGNSTVAPPNNMADRAAGDSPTDSEANAPVQAAPTGATNTNNGDGGNLAAKDQQQGDDSVPASTSARNSAADVRADESGNPPGNSLSSDAPAGGVANERRATPESSAHQNFGAPVAPVIKRQRAESTAISAAGAVTAQPFSETQQPVLVTAPDEKSGPFRLTLGEQAVSASATLAISAQRSVSIPAQPGPASAHRPERLQVGVLIYHADPLIPATRDQKGLAGTVKVQATIGKGGDVIEVKPINGPTPLIPAVVQAVREWRYTVTLLDGQPLGTEEEVVVEFRPRS
jgi:Gram-negative bacterial TonB protein C-terminal/PilZ domain